MTLTAFALNLYRSSPGPSYIDSLVQFAVCSSKSALLDHPDTEMICQDASDKKIMLYATGLVVAGAAVGYFIGHQLGKKNSRCNNHVKLSTDKVVDSVDIEEIGEKKAFCRCWKSKKFPYCDGSHGAHNKETGDNVGPLIVKKSDI